VADINLDKLDVVNNAASNRFEIKIGDHLAVLDYRQRESSIDLKHTEVPAAFEGHGLGAKLAHAALEFAKAQGLTVRASCPYVAAYIKRHPEYEVLTHRDTSGTPEF